MPPTHPVIQAIQDAMPPEGTETYNLYEKDVKTLEEVKEYLRTWFIRQPGGYSREWDGAHYTLVVGFRRGYCSHQVFVDTDTGSYIFTCDEEKEIPPFVTGEFSSFEAVIDDIAVYFAKVLEEAKFDGLLIVDDIHFNEHTQRFFDDIKQTKYDITSSEIIDIVLDPTDLNAIDLSSVNSVCRWSSNFRFFDLSAGEEHYILLAHVARSVRRPTIIDIGPSRLSAAALSLATEKTVRSFDLISSLPSDPSVPTAIHIPNVRLEIGPNYMRDLPDHLRTSDLVLLDIDHLGKSERDIFKVLEEAKFDRLLIVDDIPLNEHMQRFWDDIKQTKYDISSSGHWHR
eukprot:gene750-2167_t